jgi:pimeloyl-ACP methyl ester carboxylesterase
MTSRKLTFPGGAGEALASHLELPKPNDPLAYAIFAHCFTCSKDYKAAVYISRELAARGIGVLRFDFTGLGESGGDFADTTFSSNVQDVLAAARFLAERYRPPGLLVGHSLGGSAALLAAGRLRSVRAVAVVGTPFGPGGSGSFLPAAREQVARTGGALVEISGRSVWLRKRFFDDLDRVSMREALRDLGKPLLVLHSPSDELVDIADAEKTFRAARFPKAFVSLDGADHLLSDRAVGTYAGSVIAAWAERFLTDLRP